MAPWNSSNGAWLPGIWATPDILPSTLDFMRDHDVEYLFPTTLTLDKNGKFALSGNIMIFAHQFMNTVKEYENSPRAHGKKFKILPVINACFNPELPDDYFDLSNAEVRAAAVKSIQQFVVPGVENSYVTGMPRDFDGVQFDLVGSADNGDAYDFEILKQFMREIKAAIGSGKVTSLATPKFGGSWNSSRFYYVALYVDLLVPRCYNTGYQKPEEFEWFMRDQVHDILHAVSGKYAKNHGRPKNGIKVLFGFPSFPISKDMQTHIPAVENIATAARGAVDGVNKLISEGDDSLEFMTGASIYMYTDGHGQEGYSTKGDMDDFGSLWAYTAHPDTAVDRKPDIIISDAKTRREVIIPTKQEDTAKGDANAHDDPWNSDVGKAVVVSILLFCALLVAIG